MPKIDTISIELKTGTQGTSDPVTFQFNGHTLPFEETEGGTAPGETFRGSFEVGSYGHSVALNGPKSGEWDVEEMRVTYELDDADSYSIRFGAVKLNEDNAVNIYRGRPRPTFEV